MSIHDILDERQQSHGTFHELAAIATCLKAIVRDGLAARKKTLPDDQAEALNMICTKMARIINGNHNHLDSWRDIAGYATLISDRLEAKQRMERI